jgi:hypothetical protein
LWADAVDGDGGTTKKVTSNLQTKKVTVIGVIDLVSASYFELVIDLQRSVLR